MFSRFLNWIRQVLNRMIKKNNIEQALSVDTAVSDNMSTALDLWCSMYINDAPWLSPTVQSAGLPASIAHEFARLVMLESESSVTGSARADYLNAIYTKVLSDLRLKQLEYGLAKGALVLKPVYSDGVLSVSYVQADGFFPISVDTSTGRMTSCAFINRKIDGKDWYTRVELHKFADSSVTVRNTAYKSSNEDILGREIPLSDVEEWSGIAPVTVIKNVKQPLYAVLNVPSANNVDPASPLGVSVYSRAVDKIREADKQYSRILWEYEGSELAVHAGAEAFRRKEDGSWDVPEGRERLYRVTDDENVHIDTFSPAIRDTSLINGYESILRGIEFDVGLAYGTLSNPQSVEKTAEEIKSSKQRSYNEVSGQQGALEDALRDLVYALDVYATLYNLAPAGKYEMAFTWGDSILTDTKSEQAIRFQEASSGFISKEAYLAWRYGVTEEEAAKMVPRTQVFAGD